LEAGTLVLNDEVWLALWPDFFAGSSRSPGKVTLALADGPVLQVSIEHLMKGQAVWGIPATPSLADWYRRQEAKPSDALIVRVLDVDDHRYTVALARHADRNETAIGARNRSLVDAAERVLRAARPGLPDFYLIPRLVAHDAYRQQLPPDPWGQVLRADLRFVVGKRDASLVEKLVNEVDCYHLRILRSARACARLRSTSAPVVSRSLWVPLNQGMTSFTRSRLTMAERWARKKWVGSSCASNSVSVRRMG